MSKISVTVTSENTCYTVEDMSQIGEIDNRQIKYFVIFLCHTEFAYQKIMSLCPRLCLLAFKAHFEKKGPKKAEIQIFKKQ